MRKKLPKSNWNDDECIKDRQMGRTTESWFDNWLETNDFFKTDWETRQGKTNWDIIDYQSCPDKRDNQLRYIELKSRRTTFTQYWDTMIGENKLIEARELMNKGAKVYFFFLFTGKYGKERELYFYDTEKSRYALQKYCRISKGGTNRRGTEEYKNHMFIPQPCLHKVSDYKDIFDYHNKKG